MALLNSDKYDFSGWATKNDLKCADGLTIRKGAFEIQDGHKVPLVWNHKHDSTSAILGHAILENRDEGVYAYCKFNNTLSGKEAKEIVHNGDIVSLSIWANNLERVGNDVVHGAIREVSLVLAGANPGAFIESVIAHGEVMDESDDEALLYTGDGIYISHNEEDEEEEMSKTIGEIYDEMTDEQKQAVAAIVGQVLEDSVEEDEEDEEEKEVKHNVFDSAKKDDKTNYLSHSDMESIFADAKRTGSLKEAVENFLGDDGVLMHSIDTTGMTTATGTQTYGFNDPSMLFPDYKNLNNTPEWISRNMDWVQKVMGRVHRTPFSRIKSVYADITEDEARARGYIKGKQKKEEVFTTLKRTTDPQTIYKKQKLDRDDIIDITDFDVVAWIRAEMRVMLNEEIARAILIGDGRPSDSDDKIKEQHVRPIVTDVPLFNIRVNVAKKSDPGENAENLIDTILRARKQYKGSGNPAFYTTEDVLTEMLLLKDKVGHRLYKTEVELATALRVSEIVTVEPMEGASVTIDGTKSELVGVIVNLDDYNVGADKGGQINMFDDFDIDYNQQKYLIETRMSGALIKPFSAMTIMYNNSSAAASTM